MGQHAVLLAVLMAAIATGCGAMTPSPAPSPPPFLVTSEPIDVAGGPLCIGLDPGSDDGVWWWTPGRTGCTSRSVGPDVIDAEEARIVALGADRLAVSFRVHLIPAGSVVASLTVLDGRLLASPSGETVPLVPRRDLDLPELPR